MVSDADVLSRSGLRAVLADDPALAVVAAHADPDEVPSTLVSLRPDVLVLSARTDPTAAIDLAARLAGTVATVLLVPWATGARLAAAVAGGVNGVLVHGGFDAVDLVRTVRGCAAGETHLAPVPLPPVAPLAPLTPHRLTVRETEIMELVSAGLSNAQVAHRVHLSEKTVKNVLTRVFTKLDASNRAEAAAVYLGRADDLVACASPSRWVS